MIKRELRFMGIVEQNFVFSFWNSSSNDFNIKRNRLKVFHKYKLSYSSLLQGEVLLNLLWVAIFVHYHTELAENCHIKRFVFKRAHDFRDGLILTTSFIVTMFYELELERFLVDV